jgi:hypothetical protein
MAAYAWMLGKNEHEPQQGMVVAFKNNSMRRRWLNKQEASTIRSAHPINRAQAIMLLRSEKSDKVGVGCYLGSQNKETDTFRELSAIEKAKDEQRGQGVIETRGLLGLSVDGPPVRLT